MKSAEMQKYVPYVLLGVLIGVVVYGLAARKVNAPVVEQPAQPVETSPAADVVIGGETEAVAPSAKYPTKALPYIENGYRFQFSNCRGTPGSLVVKAGKYFLFDNRDAKSHTIAVAGQSYSVGAYGAAVAAVWKPGTYNITCDGGGAASLTVQK
ncbi:MAG: hypothetical protein WC866_02075 [Patescibacteria group bacterium]|jgi:hypothetical protein